MLYGTKPASEVYGCRLPHGVRGRTLLFGISEHGTQLPAFKVGSVVAWSQGSGDGRNQETLGAFLHYRHHGVVIDSGVTQYWDDRKDSYVDCEYATLRPATMPEVLGHSVPAERQADYDLLRA